MRIFLAIFFLLGLTSTGHSKDQIVLLIDPGHGGKDYGRLASKDDYMHEKELNLEIAQKVGKYIEEKLSNVRVIYTRTDDSYPSLSDRVKQANDNHVDYFLSIHCNGSPDNSKARGTETHIHNFDSKTSYQWAQIMEKEFSTRAGRKSRGIKTSDDRHHSLQVLKETNMPSILVEAGFMSNPGEEQYLNSVYGQEIIASAIFRAFRTFIQKKHPEINFIPNEQSATHAEGPFYRVQIMSSIDPVDTDIQEFKKLKMEVERVQVNSNSNYKYKYFVGKCTDKKEAKKIQKTARESGFKDAFIVHF